MSRIGDGGRTSDLIRRFESLALERNTSATTVADGGAPKPSVKPPMLSKRTPVANDGIWPKQDAQMHSDSLGTPTTATPSSRMQPSEQISAPASKPAPKPAPKPVTFAPENPPLANYSTSPTQDLLGVSN
ncbi:hypothetical protein IWW38_004912, partial [Coemansia aciculifera]